MFTFYLWKKKHLFIFIMIQIEIYYVFYFSKINEMLWLLLGFCQ